MGPGGTNLAEPNPPGVNAMGVPSAPAPTGAKLPPVTDDPAVVGNNAGAVDMGAMPKTPDLGSYLNPALKQYQSDLSGYQQADQANRIDPQKVKPKLWERLVGFGLGMTQLKNPENAGNVASEVVNRRRTAAEQNRSTALAPWTQRLQMDKEGVPLAESAARTAYQQGELGLKTAAENRERYTAISNSEYKDSLASIRDEVAKGNIEKAQNQLDQQQKVLEEKKDHDAEWFQMQHALLDLKEKIAEKGKDHTSQTVGAETTKANALTAAEDKYRKALKQLDLDKTPGTDEYNRGRSAIEDEHTTDLQRAQDAYEAKSSELKGAPVEHQDVESWRGKPAATSSAAPASSAKPATDTSSANAAPSAMGPKGETPVKTASDGKAKIGFYKSTGQWMLVPEASTSGGK